MKELKGNGIRKIFRSEDKRMICFDLDEGCLYYYGWGDCCTSVYFEDIELPPKDMRWRFKDVNEVEKIDEFGYRIKTTIGDIVISGRQEFPGYEGYSGCFRLANRDELNEYKDATFLEWTDDK